MHGVKKRKKIFFFFVQIIVIYNNSVYKYNLCYYCDTKALYYVHIGKGKTVRKRSYRKIVNFSRLKNKKIIFSKKKNLSPTKKLFHLNVIATNINSCHVID